MHWYLRLDGEQDDVIDTDCLELSNAEQFLVWFTYVCWFVDTDHCIECIESTYHQIHTVY